VEKNRTKPKFERVQKRALERERERKRREAIKRSHGTAAFARPLRNSDMSAATTTTATISARARTLQRQQQTLNKKSLEEKEEKYLFVNGESVSHNFQINSKTFTSLSILSGSIAGILGATDWIGLVWYCGTILVIGLVTIGWRCKNEPKRYAPESIGSAIFGQGFSGGFASFILFWTLFYNVCHLF
jgi:hypothetical protein